MKGNSAVDENLEVTPENLGMRKILLDENDRKKARKGGDGTIEFAREND